MKGANFWINFAHLQYAWLGCADGLVLWWEDSVDARRVVLHMSGVPPTRSSKESGLFFCVILLNCAKNVLGGLTHVDPRSVVLDGGGGPPTGSSIGDWVSTNRKPLCDFLLVINSN